MLCMFVAATFTDMDHLGDGICFSTIGICDVRRNCLEHFPKNTQFKVAVEGFKPVDLKNLSEVEEE